MQFLHMNHRNARVIKFHWNNKSVVIETQYVRYQNAAENGENIYKRE